MGKYDNLQIRCPKLGGEVTFAYCLQEGIDLPCARVISCWYAYFPVEHYLRNSMSEEAWDRFTKYTPRDKIATLVELIEKAKRAKKEEK